MPSALTVSPGFYGAWPRHGHSLSVGGNCAPTAHYNLRSSTASHVPWSPYVEQVAEVLVDKVGAAPSIPRRDSACRCRSLAAVLVPRSASAADSTPKDCPVVPNNLTPQNGWLYVKNGGSPDPKKTS